MEISRESVDVPIGQSFRLIRWTRSVSAVENLLADGSAMPSTGEGGHWHYHPEMEQTLFTEGCGNRFVGDHIGGFRAGDLVLLGSMLPHHWHSEKPTAGLSMQWNFPSHHPLFEFPETTSLGSLFQRASRGLRLSGATRDLVARQMRALAGANGLVRLGRLLELLATIANAPADAVSPLASPCFVPPIDETHQKSMSRVLRHLVVNFRDTIALDEMLKLSRMSRPTFVRQFKRHTGRSTSEFLIELRLQAACRQLADSERRVLEIALSCGFSQVSFFNRTFRRVMGCSPLAFRLRQRG